MKKPFLYIGGLKDVFKIGISAILCVFVIYLFFLPEESVEVFSQGDSHTPKSFYGLIAEYCR